MKSRHLTMFLCTGYLFLCGCGAGGNDGSADASGGADTGGGPPITPTLRPLSQASATQLIKYLRRMRVADGTNPTRPVVWSMVNASCQDRAEVLEYGIAAAADPTSPNPVVMPDELTPQQIESLAASPAFDAVSINIAGPLVTSQTLILPDGTDAPEAPDRYYWPYHHTAAINVEGTMKVIDLSIGDEPIDVQTWISGFVDAGTPCFHMNDDEAHEVWVYWNTVFNNFDPPTPLVRQCGYTFTQMFTFRRDQTPADLAEFIKTAPATMLVQLGNLQTTLTRLHSTTLDEEQLPAVTSRYQAGTVDDVCARVPGMKFCGGSGGSGGLVPPTR